MARPVDGRGGDVARAGRAARSVDAAVIYAWTSSLAADNWKQCYRPSSDRQAVNRRIEKAYGLPSKSPTFWLEASARPYFNRVTEPLLVHHGLDDDTCPVEWSRATVKALNAGGAEATLVTYRGEGHAFAGQWQRSIEHTVGFFDQHLG